MADVKISALPSATTPLAGTEQIPLVQSGATKKVTVDGLFTSANLGTPSAISLTNATNVPVAQAVGVLPVNHGGTGTTTPSIVAGTNVTVSGTWPNQTINSVAGAVTGVTATAPVVSSGGAAPDISMAAATASVNGYLTSTDWNTFNNKLTSGGALGTPSSGTATNLTGLPLTTGVTGLLPVANGGTGTATPALVAGTNVTISGSWPNQTINSSGGGSMTYPDAGIANSTGTAWGTSYTTSGTGTVVALTNSPTFVTPALGTPSALVGTNITGTAAGLTAGNVTTNANLTGAVTSVGNATSLGSFTSSQLATALTDETGSGSAVFATSPTLVTPVLGTPTSGDFSTGAFTWPTFNQNTSGTAAGLSATLVVASGGTGAASLALNNVILGNGTSAVQVVAPGTNGNVLTSNGTTWSSTAPSGITTGKSIAMAMIFGF